MDRAGEMNLFRRAETLTLGDSLPWDAVLAALPFNADGLLPAIAQQADSGEVLMLAWMNREAILETLSSGRVCYWSRSRQTLWRKGETSGHQQSLKELRIDCDGDTLLLLVDQQGPACHTRRASCFYHAVRGEQVVVISEPQRIDESRFNQP
ncbi:MAG: phosphoribosyl-AMP cyclohydrolase [Proteobacteria bacterium ST_bin11]|nr:MAG: phosphoribosyl-AMP cyclohydrolase [Proteobacteria bacterium ST_bin11]